MTRTISLLVFLCTLTAVGRARDPFWPIGYTPGADAAPTPRPEAPDEPPEPEPRKLTDEELRRLAREEADRIRQSIRRKATMKAGDRIYAYVQNKWVTVGDSFTVKVRGRNYRLEILDLTEDNIELEPHRVSE